MQTLGRNFTIIVNTLSEIVNTGTCKPHGCDISFSLSLLSLSLSLSHTRARMHTHIWDKMSSIIREHFPQDRCECVVEISETPLANCKRHNAASRFDVDDISRRCFVDRDRITSGFHAGHFGRRKRSSDLSDLSFYCDDY